MGSLKSLVRSLSSLIGYGALTVGLAFSVEFARAEVPIYLVSASVKVVCTNPTSSCEKDPTEDKCKVQGKACKSGEDCFCEWDKSINDTGCKCMK
jgi:hypothetical protein